MDKDNESTAITEDMPTTHGPMECGRLYHDPNDWCVLYDAWEDDGGDIIAGDVVCTARDGSVAYGIRRCWDACMGVDSAVLRPGLAGELIAALRRLVEAHEAGGVGYPLNCAQDDPRRELHKAFEQARAVLAAVEGR